MRAGLGAQWEWVGKSSIITRWTPGARRDTPGFIGLGTFQGPHYSVYICPAMDTRNAYRHTSCCTRHWNPIQKASPNSLMFLWQQDNKHSLHMGRRPFTLRWSLQSCFSSAVFIRRSVEAKKSARLSLLARHRHSEDVLMYGRTFVNFGHWQHDKNVPCTDKTEIFLFLLCRSVPLGIC